MPLSDVKNAVAKIVERMDGNARLADDLHGNELRTRYVVIDPILWALGWQTWKPEEVTIERRRGTGRGRVDYALLNREGKPMVLIEAKKWYRQLDRYSADLARYARGLGHGVACITDGWEWVIYDLEVRGGSFEKKYVASIDLMADRNAAAVLNRWLRKTRWW